MLNVSKDHEQHITFVKLKWYIMKKKVRNESTDKRQNFLDTEHNYREKYDTFLILQGTLHISLRNSIDKKNQEMLNESNYHDQHNMFLA
jgi:hypothetical protein